jgi:hypothetical protein
MLLRSLALDAGRVFPKPEWQAQSQAWINKEGGGEMFILRI